MGTKRDAELLRAHLDGDSEAFAELSRRYADELFGFVVRFVNRASVAEDIVQDTFLQMHLSAETFDFNRKLKPWLYTIAANKARDYLRSRGRRQEQSLDSTGRRDDEGPSPAAALPDEGPSAEDLVSDDEQRAQVRAVIDEMPEHLRTILLMGYFQKLPYAEIAEVLDIPLGTVKSRLHAAVNHFATLWRRTQDESERVVNE
jgi:RNA polymerase sigma-70 factor (ECF subfamily)